MSYYNGELQSEMWNEKLGLYYGDFTPNSYTYDASEKRSVSIPFDPICLPDMVENPKVKLHQLTLGEYRKALKNIRINYPNNKESFHHFRLRECSSSNNSNNWNVISNPSYHSNMAHYVFFCNETTRTYVESDLTPDIDVFLSSSKNEVSVINNYKDQFDKLKKSVAKEHHLENVRLRKKGSESKLDNDSLEIVDENLFVTIRDSSNCVLIMDNTECVRELINNSYNADGLDAFNLFVIATAHGFMVTDNLKEFMKNNPPDKNTHVCQYTMRHIFGSDHTDHKVLNPVWEYLLKQGGNWCTLTAVLDFGLNSPHRIGDKHYGRGTTHRYRTIPGPVVLVVPAGEAPIHTPNAKIDHYFDRTRGSLFMGNSMRMTRLCGKASNDVGFLNLKPPSDGQTLSDIDEDYDEGYNSNNDSDDENYSQMKDVVKDLRRKRDQLTKVDSVYSKLLKVPPVNNELSIKKFLEITDNNLLKEHLINKTTEQNIRQLLVNLLDVYRLKISYFYALDTDRDSGEKNDLLNYLCTSFRKNWNKLMSVVPRMDCMDQQSLEECLQSRLEYTNKILNFNCDYLTAESEQKSLFGSVKKFILLAVERASVDKLGSLVYPQNFQHYNGFSITAENFFNMRMICGVASWYNMSRHFVDLQSYRKNVDKSMIGFSISEKASEHVCGCGCEKDQNSIGKYYHVGMPEVISSEEEYPLKMTCLAAISTPDVTAYFHHCRGTNNVNLKLGGVFERIDDYYDNDDDDDECGRVNFGDEEQKIREDYERVLKCLDNLMNTEFVETTKDSYNQIKRSVKINYNDNDRWNYLTTLVQRLMDDDLGHRCVYGKRNLAINIANTMLTHMMSLNGIFCYAQLVEKKESLPSDKIEHTYNILKYIIDNVFPLTGYVGVNPHQLNEYMEILESHMNKNDLKKKRCLDISSLLHKEKISPLISVSHEELNSCLQTFLLSLLITISDEWKKFINMNKNSYSVEDVSEIVQFVKSSSKFVLEEFANLQTICKNEFECKFVTSNKIILPISIYHCSLLNYFIGNKDIKNFDINDLEAHQNTQLMTKSVLYRGLIMMFDKLCNVSVTRNESNVELIEKYIDLLHTGGKVFLSCNHAGIEMSRVNELNQSLSTKHKFVQFWQRMKFIQLNSNATVYENKMSLNQTVERIKICTEKKLHDLRCCNNNKRSVVGNNNYYDKGKKRMCTERVNFAYDY